MMRKQILFTFICIHFIYALTWSNQLTDSQKEICQSVKTVKINVVQDYGEAVKKDLPFKSNAAKFLSKYTNLLVTKGDTLSYDAILNIDVKGTALSTKYGVTHFSSYKEVHYSGAKFEGHFSYEINKITYYKGTFKGHHSPPPQIKGVYRTPQAAPFEKAFKNSTLNAELVKMIGMIYGIDPIIIALEDQDEKVRKSALKTCIEINDLRAVEPLIKKLQKKDSEIDAFIIDALGKLKDPRAVPALCSELKDFPFASAKALAEINDSRAIKPLIDALNTTEKINARKQIGKALKKITGKNYKENYTKWLNWWEENKNNFLNN